METTGLGAPLALALLVPMEAGIPIPLPADLVMLLVGEQAAAGKIPLWLAIVALEAVAVIGTTVLFLLARGPGHALVERVGPKVGLTKGASSASCRSSSAADLRPSRSDGGHRACAR